MNAVDAVANIAGWPKGQHRMGEMMAHYS